jgi:hypothetical protein
MSRPPDPASGAPHQNIVALLNGPIGQASGAQRQRILAEVTDLFLRVGMSANEESRALFDDLFLRLTAGLDSTALVTLARALAQTAAAPIATLRMLAWHESAAVAAPILAQSEALSGDDLAALAATVETERLRAICTRPRIDKPLTSVIVARDNAAAIAQLLANPGVAFAIPDFRFALARAVSDARGRVELRQPVDILDFAGRRGGRCITRDISPGGIKIELAGGGRPPDSFMLEMPGIGHARLTCRYVWHRDSTVGAMLSEPLFDQLAAQPPR